MFTQEIKDMATALVEQVATLKEKVKNAVLIALQEHGKAVEFDYDNGDAPSINVGCFDDDVTDAYITKIWADGGLVKANLHAYYLGDDREDIDLGDECLGASDWADILDYVISNAE